MLARPSRRAPMPPISVGPEAAARALASEAFVRGSCDNISCVVVFFDFSS